jgi:hypothetical protein
VCDFFIDNQLNSLHEYYIVLRYYFNYIAL